MRTREGRKARPVSICSGSGPCEREDAGGCSGYTPSNQSTTGFLPLTACWGGWQARN